MTLLCRSEDYALHGSPVSQRRLKRREEALPGTSGPHRSQVPHGSLGSSQCGKSGQVFLSQRRLVLQESLPSPKERLAAWESPRKLLKMQIPRLSR